MIINIGEKVDVKRFVDSDHGDDDMGEEMEYPEYDDDVEVLNNLRSRKVRHNADAGNSMYRSISVYIRPLIIQYIFTPKSMILIIIFSL